MKYIVGIDVGGTTVKFGIFPEEGEALYKWEIPTVRGDEEALWQSLADSVKETFKEKGLPYEDLKAAGITLPGPIREDGYLPFCVNLGTGACYPGKALGELLGVPAAAINDGNAAALGETYYGAAKGSPNTVTLTLGTGVGGGVVVDGKIVAGKRGVGGEIGHFVVNPDETERCNCGNYGCLEQYASATGMVRIAKKLLRTENRVSSLRAVEEEKLSAKDVCDAAKAGDVLALEVLDIYGKYLGLAVSHLFLTNDPDVIVIGGGVSRAGEILIRPVEKYLERFTHIATEKCRVVLAELGNDAGIFGAAALAKTVA